GSKIVRILFQHASKSPSARHIVARKASREPRARSVGTAEFWRFLRRCIGGCQEASLAREGKNIWRLRTLFYGAAARLRSHTAKTQSKHGGLHEGENCHGHLRRSSSRRLRSSVRAICASGHGDGPSQGSDLRLPGDLTDRHREFRRAIPSYRWAATDAHPHGGLRSYHCFARTT